MPKPDGDYKTASVGEIIIGALTWLTGGWSWQNIKTILIALAIALVIRWVVAEPFKIPSGSMEPTLQGNPGFLRGDRVFVNKWIYGLRYPLDGFQIPFTNIVIDYAESRIWRGKEPQRWEIVVFKSPEAGDEGKTLIKRIIALPGERVHIRGGRVYINGELLAHPDFMPETAAHTTGANNPEMRYGFGMSDRYTLVPEDHYFLMGDNRRYSRDGRVWGWVPNDHLLGRTFCVWWPPAHWSDFTGFSRTWWWRLILGVVGLLTIWRIFLGRSWRVHPPAPDADLRPGDHLYIDRLALGLVLPFTRTRLTTGKRPSRGALVVYHGPKGVDPHGDLLLGRVAAFPGEQVFTGDGRVEIDGSPVEQGPLAERQYPSTEDVGPFGRSKGKSHSLVPEDHYFILSDDPAAASDSRSFGWVPAQDVVGVAKAIWLPFKRMRKLES
jgi:signal peptidase I